MKRKGFPADFLWGVATSSFQIEGAYDQDGRGESIWDRFAATPGRVADGSNARVACDHYHRWREDIELMRELGVGAYRFSIAWPRIVPGGTGPVNEAGLDFYEALVDRLLEVGIKPFVTLYHWDLPQVLEDRGGWSNRDTAAAFVEYSTHVVKRLGDRVSSWVTHNEPWCIATLGYEKGAHAPGWEDPERALRAAHHVLLSHGWTNEMIRSYAPAAQVGIVLNLTPSMPASESAADVDAARWFDGQFNRWFLDPLLRGSYPADSVQDRIQQGHLPDDGLSFVRAGDLKAIARPLDFLGVNYYTRAVLHTDGEGKPESIVTAPQDELTDMGWELYPQGLHDLLVRLDREYDCPPIYITENGAAYSDGPDDAGRVRDTRRVEYLRTHLAATQRAMAAGVDVRGYFAWSLLDNFEWGHGIAKRFGLYWIDYASQQRIAKDSAFWYRDFIQANTTAQGAM